MRFRSSLAALALLLVGCSSDGGYDKALTTLRDAAVARFGPAPVIRAPAGPYVVIGYQGARTPMAETARRGDVVSYEGFGGVEMTLYNGFLARLRGLGQEFEAFYPAAGSLYLGDFGGGARDGSTAVRTVEYWIDQQPKRYRFRCRIAHGRIESKGRRIDERCESIYGGLSFDNIYWLDASGALVHSSQFFHPDTAQLLIEHRPTPTIRRRPVDREG